MTMTTRTIREEYVDLGQGMRMMSVDNNQEDDEDEDDEDDMDTG